MSDDELINKIRQGDEAAETFQQMVKDYNDLGRPGLQSGADWQLASGYLNQLYPELADPENQTYQPLIHYVDTEKLTNFYEKRQEFLEYNMEVNRQNGLLTEDDVETLRDMDSQVEEPYKYEWVQGWSNLLSTSLASTGSSMAPYLAIVLAFTFSGEWHSNNSCRSII